jgi:hypothetical protein
LLTSNTDNNDEAENVSGMLPVNWLDPKYNVVTLGRLNNSPAIVPDNSLFVTSKYTSFVMFTIPDGREPEN